MPLRRNGFQIKSKSSLLPRLYPWRFDVHSIKLTVLLAESTARVSAGCRAHRSGDPQLLIRVVRALHACRTRNRPFNVADSLHCKLQPCENAAFRRALHTDAFFPPRAFRPWFSMVHTSKINGLGRGCGNIREGREDVSSPPIFWDPANTSETRRVQPRSPTCFNSPGFGGFS